MNEGNADYIGDFSFNGADVETASMKAPCKGCERPQKQLGCHDFCQEFIAFQKENEELKEKMRKEKARMARRPYMTAEQFRNAGKRANKVFKQHKK